MATSSHWGNCWRCSSCFSDKVVLENRKVSDYKCDKCSSIYKDIFTDAIKDGKILYDFQSASDIRGNVMKHWFEKGIMGVKLFLIRHGQTELNLEGRYQGSMDTQLTSVGIQQAKLAKEYLSRVIFSSIYSSPLKRALDTASIIADNEGPKIIVRENLKEIDFGKWEGLKFNEIKIWEQSHQIKIYTKQIKLRKTSFILSWLILKKN